MGCRIFAYTALLYISRMTHKLKAESLDKLLRLLECQTATNIALYNLVMDMNEKYKASEKKEPKQKPANMQVQR